MLNGIDVSYAQGNIDFSNLDKSKVQFAIIRSSFGWEANQKDNQFERNYSNFKKLGIPIGAYHYSYARTADQAIKEAKYCIECIKGKTFELPIYIDIEDNSVISAGRRNLTDVVKAFCDYMKQHGYRTGFYTNPSWLENYLYKDELLGKYSLWLAHWGVSKPSYSYDAWQYNVGSRKDIDGISGEIDLDYCKPELVVVAKNTPTNTPTVVLSDCEKYLDSAKTFIGKSGYYVCKTKLGLPGIFDWCAFVVSLIFKELGFIGKYIDKVYGGAGDIPRYNDGKYGIWFKKGSKAPKPGDLFFMRYSDYPNEDKYFCDHVGIVEKVNGNTLTTLEGNVDGITGNWAATSTFKRKTRYLNDSNIYAFFRPNWVGSTTATAASAKTNNKTVEELANEVIAGKWDSGDKRKRLLTSAGYDYSAVQTRVNELLSKSSSPQKTTEEIAKEVIAGKWGNGDERKKKLTAAGYDYDSVQLLVNALMSGTSASNNVYYTVRAGDTLSSIANKYGTTYQAIAKLNNISNPNLIYAGQRLRIK